jgi:hypothetical protein
MKEYYLSLTGAFDLRMIYALLEKWTESAPVGRQVSENPSYRPEQAQK